MVVRTVLVSFFVCLSAVAVLAELPASPIVYPRENSVVGSRVNLVLDPTEVPFFQVLVGRTEYPIVDTSTGRHAYQGLELEPGLNTITVKVFAQPDVTAKEEGKGAIKEKEQVPDREQAAGQKSGAVGLTLVSTWTRQVFSKVELLTRRAAPTGFKREFFHSRERETGCAGCHNLEALPGDATPPQKPGDIICNVCHRKIPTGRHIHGPAAVWSCLECHDPNAQPVKYQFATFDPWKVKKTTGAVRPVLFTLPADALFKPHTAVLLSEEADTLPSNVKGKKSTPEPARKNKQQELFAPLLEHIAQNPDDRILVEAHVDAAPLPKEKGKRSKGTKDHQQLTDARAKAVEKVLKEYGITGKNRVVTAGRGSSQPKTPVAGDGRALNNRIDIVVHPQDVIVRNTRELSALNDLERVSVTVGHSRGGEVRGLKVIERVPHGMQYVKGSGLLRGNSADPRVRGEELVWEIGDRGPDFQESFTYVMKKEKGAAARTSPVVRLQFMAGQQEETRNFDPANRGERGLTEEETCKKCHPDMITEPFKHGPVDAGYCTVCHDPHASNYPAWTRKSSYRLCTTCHAEKKTGGHVVAGIGRGLSHPTKKKHDPARPGKRLSCPSCHAPHSARTRDLLAFDVLDKAQLCEKCHPKK